MDPAVLTPFHRGPWEFDIFMFLWLINRNTLTTAFSSGPKSPAFLLLLFFVISFPFIGQMFLLHSFSPGERLPTLHDVETTAETITSLIYTVEDSVM